jgi:hypothetical protein
VACNPQAGLYVVLSYAGPSSGYFSGPLFSVGSTITQAAKPGTNYVLLATDLSGNPRAIEFALSVFTKIKLPNGDRTPVPLALVGGRRTVELSASCSG